MADRIMRIHPRSPEELDRLLDKCKGLANGEHVVVTVFVGLRPPRNKPCPFCDSGKKWKKCACSEEDSYQLTFYPDGYQPPKRLSKRAALAWLTLAESFARPD